MKVHISIPWKLVAPRIPLHVPLHVLPLCSIVVHVPRTDTVTINPRLARVVATASLTPPLATAPLRAVDFTGAQARINTDRGNADAVKIECAIVKCTEHASALKPFLTSPLNQVLRTHNACGNVDTVCPRAHTPLFTCNTCHLLDFCG